MAEVYKRKVYFCGQDCIESFRTTRINPQFKKLPIENFYSAAAPNSGPLALLYRKYGAKQLKLPENYDNCVLLFNCKGDLLRMVPFELKERVILFEFTLDQQLLIVYANGNYFLIDPATATTSQGCLFAEDDIKSNKDIKSNRNRCLGAQLVGEKIVVLKQRVLGVVQSLGVPWKAYPVIKLNIDNPVFGCSLNTQGELQIVYHSVNGTIDLLNIRKWNDSSSPPSQLYADQILKNHATKLVSLVKKEERLGFVFTDRAVLARVNSGSLFFPFNEFIIAKEDPLSKSESKQKYRNFYRLGFIEDTLYFYDRVRLLLISLDEPHFEIRHLSLTSLLASSSVGFRLIDEHTFTFRVIRNSIYFRIVEKQEVANRIKKHRSQEENNIDSHFQQLAEVYSFFMERKPIEMSFVNKVETYAEEVYNAVMETACLYIDPGQQLMALRFANFLLTYFRFASRSRAIAELSQQLRVVNNLRHQSLNRWITYHQFQQLKQNDRFLLLLLRYNMHFVADMVFQESKHKQRILAHWAKCKIEKETEANALQEIKARYKEMKVDIGATYIFTQLARYCLEHKQRNLINLALQLIELQPHPARRTIVFLFIFLAKKEPQSVDKLLEYAEQCNNVSAIHQTIQSLRKVSQDWLPSKAWLQLLPRKPCLQYHYIRILKANNQLQELKEYLTLNGLFVQMSYTSLGKQLAKMQNPTLQKASQLVSNGYAKVLTSLSDNLSRCSIRNGMETLRQLKNKKQKITLQDVNSLTKDGELQVLAEIIMKKDNNSTLAAQVLRKIKSDKVYNLLVRKGKVKDAMDEAFNRNNKEKLLELIPMAEQSLQQYGRQYYEQLCNNKR